ncbi:cytochrome c biogenesis protein CcsA [bacterium]|nr:cytochrome c biogenesis protein CcsA [bacterium]
MTDVSFFWIAFVAYLAGMFALGVATLRREMPRAAQLGRALMWVGVVAQTASIVWRSLILGTEPLRDFWPRLRAAFAEGTWHATVYALLLAVPLVTIVIGVLCRRRRTVWLLVAGGAVIVEMILLDFLDFARLPMEKVYEYLSIASWTSALALLAVSPVIRLVVIDAALAVSTVLLAVFAAIHPHDIELQLVPALQSYWLFIHVSLTSFGFAIFGVAYVVAGLLLVKAAAGTQASAAWRRRSRVALLLAIVIGAGAVAAFVGGGLALPFDEVAYAPHELTDGTAPQPVLMQYVRYGSALLGAAGVVAYAAYWIVLAFVRPRGDRTGRASYQFAISSTAMFVACLLLAAFTQRQERTIRRLHEERSELVELHNQLLDEQGNLSGDALTEEIARRRALAKQARGVLAKARWLPLTLDNQARLLDDPEYKELESLYAGAEIEWKLPIRYKDIKQIGRTLGRRAAVAEAVVSRLSLPADRDEVVRVAAALEAEGKAREVKALLPRTKEGQLASFTGLGMLIACVLAWALALGSPAVAERLPSVERLDRISYVAVAVGYPIFTFGALFAGALWAHYAWGTWWGWDPKEVGSLVAWVLYTIYLHQRYREGLSPRTAAVAAMLGFLAAVLSLAGNSFLGGLHAYS